VSSGWNSALTCAGSSVSGGMPSHRAQRGWIVAGSGNATSPGAGVLMPDEKLYPMVVATTARQLTTWPEGVDVSATDDPGGRFAKIGGQSRWFVASVV
jgi:hypothetical protein